jgi:type II secretory pathway component PulF
MTNQQRATLYHEFAKLLAAGLHADRSIDLLLEHRPAAPVRKFLRGIRKGLDQRLGFSEAIINYNTANTSKLETSLLAAGERGGRLEDACEHLARYFELRQKSIDKVVGALIYPLILVHFALILPEFVAYFSGTPLAQIIPDLIFRLIVLWAILAAFAMLWLQGAKAAAQSTSIDGLIGMIPLVGSINRHWALARFCQVFHTGLLAALNISETVKLAGAASQSALLHRATIKASKEIIAGQPLTAALRSGNAFPRSFLNAVNTAETTGTLDIELGRWAQIEGELAARSQDRAAEWLPRLFYVAVVFYIASRIIALFQTLYGEGSAINELLNAH